MVIPNIVNIFALNLNKITMDDLNRLKVVPVVTIPEKRCHI